MVEMHILVLTNIPGYGEAFRTLTCVASRLSDDIPSLPLITISIVRTVSFTIYTSTKRIVNSTYDEGDTTQSPGAGSSKTPWVDLRLGVLNQNTTRDVALTSLMAGGASGAVVCVGSAPFELVKVSCNLISSRKHQLN